MAHTDITMKPVTMGRIPCPLEGCDETIEVKGSLLIEAEDGVDEIGAATTTYRLGSTVHHESIELHMVEHGIDPQGEIA